MGGCTSSETSWQYPQDHVYCPIYAKDSISRYLIRHPDAIFTTFILTDMEEDIAFRMTNQDIYDYLSPEAIRKRNQEDIDYNLSPKDNYFLEAHSITLSSRPWLMLICPPQPSQFVEGPYKFPQHQPQHKNFHHKLFPLEFDHLQPGGYLKLVKFLPTSRLHFTNQLSLPRVVEPFGYIVLVIDLDDVTSRLDFTRFIRDVIQLKLDGCVVDITNVPIFLFTYNGGGGSGGTGSTGDGSEIKSDMDQSSHSSPQTPRRNIPPESTQPATSSNDGGDDILPAPPQTTTRSAVTFSTIPTAPTPIAFESLVSPEPTRSALKTTSAPMALRVRDQLGRSGTVEEDGSLSPTARDTARNTFNNAGDGHNPTEAGNGDVDAYPFINYDEFNQGYASKSSFMSYTRNSPDSSSEISSSDDEDDDDDQNDNEQFIVVKTEADVEAVVKMQLGKYNEDDASNGDYELVDGSSQSTLLTINTGMAFGGPVGTPGRGVESPTNNHHGSQLQISTLTSTSQTIPSPRRQQQLDPDIPYDSQLRTTNQLIHYPMSMKSQHLDIRDNTRFASLSTSLSISPETLSTVWTNPQVNFHSKVYSLEEMVDICVGYGFARGKIIATQITDPLLLVSELNNNNNTNDGNANTNDAVSPHSVGDTTTTTTPSNPSQPNSIEMQTTAATTTTSPSSPLSDKQKKRVSIADDHVCVSPLHEPIQVSTNSIPTIIRANLIKVLPNTNPDNHHASPARPTPFKSVLKNYPFSRYNRPLFPFPYCPFMPHEYTRFRSMFDLPTLRYHAAVFLSTQFSPIKTHVDDETSGGPEAPREGKEGKAAATRHRKRKKNHDDGEGTDRKLGYQHDPELKRALRKIFPKSKMGRSSALAVPENARIITLSNNPALIESGIISPQLNLTQNLTNGINHMSIHESYRPIHNLTTISHNSVYNARVAYTRLGLKYGLYNCQFDSLLQQSQLFALNIAPKLYNPHTDDFRTDAYLRDLVDNALSLVTPSYAEYGVRPHTVRRLLDDTGNNGPGPLDSVQIQNKFVAEFPIYSIVVLYTPPELRPVVDITTPPVPGEAILEDDQSASRLTEGSLASLALHTDGGLSNQSSAQKRKKKGPNYYMSTNLITGLPKSADEIAMGQQQSLAAFGTGSSLNRNGSQIGIVKSTSMPQQSLPGRPGGDRESLNRGSHYNTGGMGNGGIQLTKSFDDMVKEHFSSYCISNVDLSGSDQEDANVNTQLNQIAHFNTYWSFLLIFPHQLEDAVKWVERDALRRRLSVMWKRGGEQ